MRTVITSDNRQVQVIDDGLPRVHRADIQNVCALITTKPAGFDFVGTTPDYTLVARTLSIDPFVLQAQYLRGREPNADSDDEWCFRKLDMACAICELEMVKEWRRGDLGSSKLLETYFRKYSKTVRECVELELRNYLDTAERVLPGDEFLKLLGAMRVQNPAEQALETYNRIHLLEADVIDTDGEEEDD